MAVRGVVDQGAGGTIVTSVSGTANQVTVTPTTGASVVSLPATIVTPGSLAIGAGAAITTSGVGGALGTGAFAAAGAVQSGVTTWTPADGSGAGLAFTSINVNYTKIGNMVWVYGSFVYPANASGSSAIVSGLPVSVANANYAYIPGATRTNAALPVAFNVVNNTTTMGIFNAQTGAAVTNIQLTGATLWFSVIYPAA